MCRYNLISSFVKSIVYGIGFLLVDGRGGMAIVRVEYAVHSGAN